MLENFINKLKRTGESAFNVTIDDKPIKNKKIWLWLLIVTSFTFITYIYSLKDRFVNWDDIIYVNRPITDLSPSGIKDIFWGKNRFFMGNYHPVTMISLAVDYKINNVTAVKKIGNLVRGEPKNSTLKKYDPFIFHLNNLLLHLCNTILVFWLVVLLFKNFTTALISAILFGVSTLHVESVVWISERKDVLYSFFYLLSLICYILYIQKQEIKFFYFSLLLFLFSILSKAQAVSLTPVLLLIDYFYNRNFFVKKVLIEKLPFFILSLLFGYIAILAQKEANAIQDIFEYNIITRIIFVCYSFSQYIIKLTIPYHLAAIYPYPSVGNNGYPAFQYWPFILMVATIIIVFIKNIRKKNIIAFSIAFFVINIFLVLQFLPVGQAIMADRYSYIPSIGYFVLLSYFFIWLLNKLPKLKIVIQLGILGYIIIMSVLTYKQTKVWECGTILWKKTLSYYPNVITGWNNLGCERSRLGEKAKAIKCYTEALKYNPNYWGALNNRGINYFELNIYDQALVDFTKANSIQKNHESFLYKGLIYNKLKDYKKALSCFDSSLIYKQFSSKSFFNRGTIKFKMNLYHGAIYDFTLALKYSPENHHLFYFNKGLVYFELKDYKSAMKNYNLALKLRPYYYECYLQRAKLKRQLDDINGAKNDCDSAIKYNNNLLEAVALRDSIKCELQQATEKNKYLQVK